VSNCYRRHGERAFWPDTSMAHAFLIGLAKWTLTHLNDDDAKVMLPTGLVNAEELIRVLRALESARQQTNYPTPKTEREVNTNAA
jgi:hypothetical protein